MTYFRSFVLASVVTLALCAAPAQAYTPLPSSGIVAKVNAFRAEQGFPAGVVEQAGLSSGCRLHNNWMRLNKIMMHGEPEGTSGYTAAGNSAGGMAVLASGPTWRNANPWLNAPLHLALVLRPEMVITGASEEFGYSCLVTNAQPEVTPDTPSSDTYYSYPADGGSVPYTQTVFEAPTSPQTLGANPIRDGVPTGPNLIAFYRGPQMDYIQPALTSATLTDPGGAPVPIKIVSHKDSGLVSGGNGIVIPRVRLQAGATYTWTTTFTAPADGADPAFSFTSPARTFQATAKRLCGNGDGGWYKADDCPVRLLRATVARKVRIGALARPMRIPVVLDGPGQLYATAWTGATTLAYRKQTVGATGRATVALQVSRSGRASLAKMLRTRRSVVITVNVSTSANNRSVRVVVTR